ncbi:MAG: peptide chain release factor N(5)-glutamine methyltransferase [Alphaproteobacteria bacterium]
MLGFDDLVQKASSTLAAQKIANPRRDANLLLRLAANLSPEQAMMAPTRTIDRETARLFDTFVARRARGEPVSRIRGMREFWSLDFEINAATLDPRADSEVLVVAVVEALAKRGISAPRILDLGTGSGCLLVSLLSEMPRAVGIGVDLDPHAAATAMRNARRNGVDRRASFVVSNWHAAIDAPFDVVVSNPPYISTEKIPSLEADVRRYDPRLALDGGHDGLTCYRLIGSALPGLLTEGGLAAFEVGMDQSRSVAAILTKAGLSGIDIRPDLAGIPRCVLAEKG